MVRLQNALSTERLARYNNWAGGNNQEALELYALNVSISEAFYTSLHILEITLRNSIHDAMTAQYGAGWFQNAAVISVPYHQRKVQDAINKFQGQPTDGQVVAELTFGFWTGLFGRNQFMLWGRCLHNIFDAGYPVKRKQIAIRLDKIRHLRNRIAHHEPIIQNDLIALHQDIRELIGWLSTEALVWCDARCRFTATHPQTQIIIGNLKNPALNL